MARVWPAPKYEEIFRELCQEQQKLTLPLMQSVLHYLGQDPHAFDQRLTGANFGLRLNYYPPIAETDDGSGGGRLLGHEDVALFTLLPAPQVEGLQVLNRSNFKWVRLSPPRGTVVLSTGDYMQRITNDVLPSTTHRVARPRNPETKALPRASFPLNVYLDEEEILEVLPGLGQPKYEPVKAIAFHTRITSKYYGEDYAEDFL